jgi:dTDP-4-dehydrorhamnose 3,5-epimerase
MIEGVKSKLLKVIPDERGALMEILRVDENNFLKKFGQVYMTTAYPGVVKGWHYHKLQDDNFVVIKGMIKLVLYDRREGSATFDDFNEFFIGEYKLIMVHIPKGVVHGFKGIGIQEAIIINTVTEPYNYETPDEYRIDPHGSEISYDWGLKDG